MRPNVKHQCDHNAGLTGGLLVSVMHEPFNARGNWELFASARLPQPDGVQRSGMWVPRSSQSEACPVIGSQTRDWPGGTEYAHGDTVTDSDGHDYVAGGPDEP
jgi:hypothetical protein